MQHLRRQLVAPPEPSAVARASARTRPLWGPRALDSVNVTLRRRRGTLSLATSTYAKERFLVEMTLVPLGLMVLKNFSSLEIQVSVNI
ncbi:hypothetical protein RHGRI_000875 [Rhododendron griersonianum]|uniref:Uncharacterized protein n=1 Tax=Rhododendron griersonianum TaxID=479676 RepID=A0AAV6LLP8_9ERIC|nr:hypothetical protein RHGRI_000875 [Rhododendron griersonianum]